MPTPKRVKFIHDCLNLKSVTLINEMQGNYSISVQRAHLMTAIVNKAKWYFLQSLNQNSRHSHLMEGKLPQPLSLKLLLGRAPPLLYFDFSLQTEHTRGLWSRRLLCPRRITRGNKMWLTEASYSEAKAVTHQSIKCNPQLLVVSIYQGREKNPYI